ncbi:hypothetical protein ALP05_03989 [Pseudomonas caricapapayae]|uniref:Uncharacterized protein n=2 Tax=Pseudomonas caricapapayae TaxID=46678 RepID=A0A3M6EVL5_9PSED|nr:hypothetical protein [Pseudomonas caricapapayae]RMV72157.1 hypothetical protein ALP05_03989 [Pseudomonas caricapapayae]
MTNKPNDVRVPREMKCWSCKAVFTLSDHADCDGCCWKCGVEIDLHEMDIQPADQQGEPVAVMYDDGSVLTKADCLSEEVFEICCKVHTPLYRHAHPATAKVALPERMKARPFQTVDRGSPSYVSAWNACLDEVAKLNTPQ